MRFWDSSALVPLFVKEAATPWARELVAADSQGIIWACTPVEVRSALARRIREGSLLPAQLRDVRPRSEKILAEFSQVILLGPVIERALRVLDTHPLRAADALQLAAALVVSRERPAGLPFVTLDDRLAEVAEREGFPVITR